MYLIRYLAPFPLIAFILLSHIAIYFGLRLIFFSLVEPDVVDRHLISYALYIGLKFDARYAVFTALPVIISLLIPYFERLLCKNPSFYRKIICSIQTCIFATFAFVYITDFIVFLYTRQRIDMSVVEFVENPIISAIMVWQSYPVIKLALGLLAFLVVYYLFYNWLIKKSVPVSIVRPVAWKDSRLFSKHFCQDLKRYYSNFEVSFSLAIVLRVCTILVLAVLIMGQVSSSFFPLRWSNAYIGTDRNIPSIALHPVQNLFDTRRIFDVVSVKAPENFSGYLRMAEYLNSDNLTQINQNFDFNKPEFSRFFPARDNAETVNVVIIMMESMATNRTSLERGLASQDNQTSKEFKLDPTPFLKSIAEKSLYYPNFYVNSRTTARSIFSSLTGIPDLNFSGGTSSRNPKSINQHLIFNEFEDYEKYYLIGGNANWANIRGLLQNNIDDLKLLEDTYWQAPNVDVWGISDLALLRESIEVFSESAKPFIAFIQTAGFHRPYTIPSDNEDFVQAEEPSQAAIKYWGFENVAEYQSMRFADHALKRFFERAEQTTWFENTVFLIYGDHGLTNSSQNMNENYLNLSLQSWHVPLILYAPGKILAGINPALHSQVDIFPTLANLAGLEYLNTSFGRNMLKQNTNGQFIPLEFSFDSETNKYIYDEELAKQNKNKIFIAVSEGLTYLLQDDYAYRLNLNNESQNLFYDINTTNQNLENLIEDNPSLAEKFRQDILDFYYSAKYLIQNNKKK